MSGGSWSYLYSKELSELLDHEDLIEAIGRRISEVETNDAVSPASDTFKLLEIISDFKIEMEKLLEKLRPVWKAVEWVDSFDSGPDALDEALKKYS